MLELTDIERQTVISSADEMLRGFYCFNGAWDMEPCSEAVENKRIRWDVLYKGDPEWSYMFTRMDYLYKLTLATELTGNDTYIHHGLKIINQWRKSHWIIWLQKLKRGKVIPKQRHNYLGHRTLDMAIMASNVADYTSWCHRNGYISNRTFGRYKKMLHKLLACLTEKLWEGGKLMSNWGILESANIICCHLRISSQAPDYLYNELLRLAETQIEGEGSQIEASPMYLVQILLALLKVLKEPECSCRQELVQAALQGVRYVQSIRKLNNCIPNLGDSDETRIDDLMILAAEILGHEELMQSSNRQLGIEFAVKYGVSRNLPPVTSPKLKTEMKSMRYQTVYRSEVDGSYLLCSNIPALWPAHGHYDYLSVLWSEFGKDVLIDLGRFTYKDCAERRFLKGPAAHNTVSIVGSPFYEYIDSWRVRQRVDCYENTVVGQGHEWIAVKMRQKLGYGETGICRYVIYLYRKGLVVTDVISPNGNSDYRYETFFNIGSDFSVATDVRCLTLDDGSGHTLRYENDGQEQPTMRLVNRSLRYNELQTTQQIKVETGRHRMTHSFLLPAAGVVAPEYKGESIGYLFPQSGSYIEIPL